MKNPSWLHLAVRLLTALQNLRRHWNNPDPMVRRDACRAADAAIAAAETILTEAEGRDK